MTASMALSKHSDASDPLNAGHNGGYDYDLFSHVTHMMRQATPRADNRDTLQAVHQNTELWSRLAADFSSPDNALSNDTKAGLLALARFVIEHGQNVMTGKASSETLIDINMAIMRGLRNELSA